MPSLLRHKLLEEYRAHSSYSSPRFFIMFPMFVAVISFITAVSLSVMGDAVTLTELVTFTHVGVLVYGISVGALGVVGEMADRAGGRSQTMFTLTRTLPISRRRMFGVLYVNDVVFYTALILVPGLMGMVLSIPFTGFSSTSIVASFGCVMLSFLIGMSLSFMLSIAALRARRYVVAIAVVALATALWAIATGTVGIEWLIPSLGLNTALPPYPVSSEAVPLLATCVACVAAFSLAALAAVGPAPVVERHGRRDVLVRIDDRLRVFGDQRHLLAKELTDVWRSGGLGRMLFVYGLPLAFLGMATWYVNEWVGIPVRFNTLFFAVMVGFFGISFYNLMSSTDPSDHYETLPVSVPMVIRARLIAFAMLTYGVASAAVIAIAFANDEPGLLWAALPVTWVTLAYAVSSTAYLTGLNPNSAMFDPSVLLRFMLVSFLPMTCLTLLSFSIPEGDVVAIAGMSIVVAVLGVATVLFLRGIGPKWDGSRFT